jgi:hypothetical protein
VFKAKILSRYFPKRFLAVCSGQHLEIRRQKAKRRCKVDFDELQKDRAEIGRIAEEFALKQPFNRR